MKHYLTIEQVEREALRTKARPLYRLPRSWWKRGVAEAMSDWIKRQRGEAA